MIYYNALFETVKTKIKSIRNLFTGKVHKKKIKEKKIRRRIKKETVIKEESRKRKRKRKKQLRIILVTFHITRGSILIQSWLFWQKFIK